MSLFSSAQIDRSATQAAELFANEYLCIIGRLALAIVAGTADYTLPSYVVGIRKVMWLGWQLDPFNHREFRETNFATSSGKPHSYIFKNVGANVIKLYPNPIISVAANQTGLWNDTQRSTVVVEYFRQPNVSNTIPEYFRRRLIKSFVLKMRFLAEGKGKDVKASKYFDARWQFLKALYGENFFDNISKARMLVSGGYAYEQGMNPYPRLNSDYGIGVDLGE